MLSNTAVPKYYGKFRQDVINGKIPVNREISQEMNRIDALIENPGVYYDDLKVEGWINFCEQEMTLTDGSDLHLLNSFKLWGEQIFGWWYFVDRNVWEPYDDGRRGGHYVRKRIKKRLINKQYLIVASTKKGVENFLTGSLLEIRPMTIDKLQGLRCKIASVDEWLSGDVREDVIGAIEQGASKNDDWLILATSSEGTVRNGSGDTVKMELADILKGEYVNPHVSIW